MLELHIGIFFGDEAHFVDVVAAVPQEMKTHYGLVLEVEVIDYGLALLCGNVAHLEVEVQQILVVLQKMAEILKKKGGAGIQ